MGRGSYAIMIFKLFSVVMIHLSRGTYYVLFNFQVTVTLRVTGMEAESFGITWLCMLISGFVLV